MEACKQKFTFVQGFEVPSPLDKTTLFVVMFMNVLIAKKGLVRWTSERERERASKLVYDPPTIGYWKANELDSIQATMSTLTLPILYQDFYYGYFLLNATALGVLGHAAIMIEHKVVKLRDGYGIVRVGSVGFYAFMGVKDGGANCKGRVTSFATHRGETFQSLIGNHGWICQSDGIEQWDERFTNACALCISESSFNKIADFCNVRCANPGTYDLLSNNCLDFVVNAFKAGGIQFKNCYGLPIITRIPKVYYAEIARVDGAYFSAEGKYTL